MSDELNREEHWLKQQMEVVDRFALTIKELHGSNPYSEVPLLQMAMSQLMCGLWQEGFSQAEIQEACEMAVAVMLRFSNGEED